MDDKKKEFVCDNSDLIKEWCWEKNEAIGLDPSKLLIGSNKKAWWKCKEGHSWYAVIVSRAKGSGCPYCANQRAWRGFNDLATVNPSLANEWHPQKNGDLLPVDVTAGSGNVVWWLGKCGHEWKSSVANRKQGNGCPICMNARISQKVSALHIMRTGSLEVTNPILAKEWNSTKNGGLLPSQLTAGSTRIVWWKGPCGHEWQASPSNRNKGTNCPYCSNQRTLKGFNDLQTLFPKIAEEWHPQKNGSLEPSDFVSKSNKTVWWSGRCGHEWQQKISNRTIRKQNCPICARRAQTSYPEQALYYYIKKVFQDAQNSFKEIFDNQMELDIYIPSINVGIEYDGINWHGDEESVIKERLKYSICKSTGIWLLRVREGKMEDDLDICDEFVVSERHPTAEVLDAMITEVLRRLGKSIAVNTKDDEMLIREGYCGNIENSLLKCRPDVALTWHPTRNGNLTPAMFTVSSGIKSWWLCPICGYEWEATIAGRTAGHGCRLCGIKKRTELNIKRKIEEQGSLASNKPSLAEEWNSEKNGELKPQDVLCKSSKKVWWKCKNCGYEWEAVISSRNRGNGCPACAKEKRKVKHEKEVLS